MKTIRIKAPFCAILKTNEDKEVLASHFRFFSLDLWLCAKV